MPERRHYSKAPITEASIDLRIIPAEDFSVARLEAIGEAIGERYPTREPMYLYSGQISIEEPGYPMQTETAHEHSGFRFISQNKQQILQARSDGFTFSTFAPYDRWETFRDEARRLWNLYRSIAKAESVTRAAVRYINQINVASYAPDPDNVQLKDYVTVFPEVPHSWPGVMSGFFMQLQLWQEDLDCWLVANESPVYPPDQEVGSLRLDLDFFKEQFEEPWQADEDAAVWDFLERLHDRKNEVFEASITEETRRLIR